MNRAFPSLHGGSLEIKLYSIFKSSVILGWMTVHIALNIMNQFVVQIILVITIHAYSVNTTVFHSQALPSKIQVIYIRYLYKFITLKLFRKIKIQLKFKKLFTSLNPNIFFQVFVKLKAWNQMKKPVLYSAPG